MKMFKGIVFNTNNNFNLNKLINLEIKFYNSLKSNSKQIEKITKIKKEKVII